MGISKNLRRAALVAAVALCLGAESECDVPNEDAVSTRERDYAGGTKACEINVQRPHMSRHWLESTGDQRIIGKVTVHCHRELDSHRLRMALVGHLDSGGQKMAVDVDYGVPKPTGKDMEARVRFRGCLPGEWHMHVTAISEYQGKKYRVRLQSPEEYIDCE